MSKYPSEIITDSSIDKHIDDDKFANMSVKHMIMILLIR